MTAATLICPNATEPAGGCGPAGIHNSGGSPAPPNNTKATRHHLSCISVQYPENVLRIRSPHRRYRPRPRAAASPDGTLRMGQSATPGGQDTRYLNATPPEFQSCIPVQHPERPHRIRSPHRRRRPIRHSRKRWIRREAHCGWTGPRLRGNRGAGAPDAGELPARINSAFQCSISGSVRSPGRFQDNALKCRMAVSAAARRLRGHPSNDTPICAGCATEKIGRGRRDPVVHAEYASQNGHSGNSMLLFSGAQLSIEL